MFVAAAALCGRLQMERLKRENEFLVRECDRLLAQSDAASKVDRTAVMESATAKLDARIRYAFAI